MSYFEFTCAHAKRYGLSLPFCIRMSRLFSTVGLRACPFSLNCLLHTCARRRLALALVPALIAVSWNQVMLGPRLCFMKVVLAICSLLHFHMNLSIDLSIATKKLVTILSGIAVNLDQCGENWHPDKYWVFRFINIYQVLVSLSCSVIFSVRVLHILCQIYPTHVTFWYCYE